MRGLKTLFFLVVVVAIVAGLAAVGLRLTRDRFAAPADVKPGMIEVASLGGVHAYAARAGAHVLLFDTGMDPAGHPIDAALAALRASRADVSDVFLTHGHLDHTAAAAGFDKARIHLGAGDVALAEGKAAPDALAAKVMSKILPVPPVTATDPLNGASSVDVGDGRTVKALPVPGHTPGSYAFLYDGVLFVGDIMAFKQGQLEPTPKLFDPHPEENRAAIRSLKTQLANDTVDMVCTGHGGCTAKGLGRNLLDELVSRVGG